MTQPALALALALTLAFAGCAGNNVKAVRLDGREIKGNPALESQLEVDNSICSGEVAKADIASASSMVRRFGEGEIIFKGCMASRGYRPEPR